MTIRIGMCQAVHLPDNSYFPRRVAGDVRLRKSSPSLGPQMFMATSEKLLPNLRVKKCHTWAPARVTCRPYAVHAVEGSMRGRMQSSTTDFERFDAKACTDPCGLLASSCRWVLLLRLHAMQAEHSSPQFSARPSPEVPPYVIWDFRPLLHMPQA
eukprot:4365470-Amphidinium_carterae.1